MTDHSPYRDGLPGPTFIPRAAHLRELAALRACILLQKQYGPRSFAITSCALVLDTGTVHGPNTRAAHMTCAGAPYGR